MKCLVYIICLLFFFGCSKVPTDPPIGSMRTVIFNLDMNQIIESGEFDSEFDILYLILNESNQYIMEDQDNDMIFTVIVSELIFGKTYSYKYLINQDAEQVEERLFTVNDQDNMVVDYYGEINPTTLTFLLNMSYQIELGNFNPSTDYIDVAGSFNEWGGINSNSDYHLELTDNNIYSIIITNIEVNSQIEYKFRINGDWDNSEFAGGGNNREYTIIQGQNIVEIWYDDNPGG